MCLTLSECERGREKRQSVCIYMWMTSDYSHVCYFAETLFELLRARELSPPPPNLPSRAGVIKQIWPDRYERQGDFTSAQRRWERKKEKLSFCLPFFCHKYKNVFDFLTSPVTDGGYLAFHPSLSEYHTPCLILCVLWGPHMIFSFTVSALSIMHWTHT